MILYARALLLRNCGRFTHVSSDFGSQYHTHVFVTSEALYASLTRGVTWRHEGRFIDLDADATKSASDVYFVCDYDVSRKPIWFTPGVFVNEQLQPLAKERTVVDKNDFNVVDEDYPSTGGGGRAYFVPTYGRIESILPNHRLLTCAFSPHKAELESFTLGQTFMLGKKRTMMQMEMLSDIASGQQFKDVCTTPYLQVPPVGMGRFARFEVLAATLRYVLVRGVLREPATYWRFRDMSISGICYEVCLPEFYIQGKL